MRNSLFQRSIRWALAVVCLATMMNSANAGSFTRGCAARDLQILMLIEDRENSNAVSPEKLSDALLTMMNARMADAIWPVTMKRPPASWCRALAAAEKANYSRLEFIDLTQSPRSRQPA